MVLKSVTLAAALFAAAPFAAPSTIPGVDLGGIAMAQNKGGGGENTNGGGGSSALEGPRGIAIFARVPNNNGPQHPQPPTVNRRAPSLSTLCAVRFGEPGRADCGPS
jgi:hypothetical protein